VARANQTNNDVHRLSAGWLGAGAENCRTGKLAKHHHVDLWPVVYLQTGHVPLHGY
jgi:hypothetical protein